MPSLSALLTLAREEPLLEASCRGDALGRVYVQGSGSHFLPSMLLNHNVPPDFMQKARAGETTAVGTGLWAACFEKQATITWRGARQPVSVQGEHRLPWCFRVEGGTFGKPSSLMKLER